MKKRIKKRKSKKTLLPVVYRQGQLDWMETRAIGKEIQLQKTDVIQAFVEYAEKQRSKHVCF